MLEEFKKEEMEYKDKLERFLTLSLDISTIMMDIGFIEFSYGIFRILSEIEFPEDEIKYINKFIEDIEYNLFEDKGIDKVKKFIKLTDHYIDKVRRLDDEEKMNRIASIAYYELISNGEYAIGTEYLFSVKDIFPNFLKDMISAVQELENISEYIGKYLMGYAGLMLDLSNSTHINLGKYHVLKDEKKILLDEGLEDYEDMKDEDGNYVIRKYDHE